MAGSYTDEPVEMTEQEKAGNGHGPPRRGVTMPVHGPSDHPHTDSDGDLGQQQGAQVRRGVSQPNPRTSISAESGNGAAPPFKERLQSLFVPEHRPKREPTYAESFKAIVTCTWLNVLLIFIPVAWALHFVNVDPTITFVFCFIAIIPLAKLLGFATEEVALRVGQTLGALINATLGNAVELIVAIEALVKGQCLLVQSSLLGSILSNALLVLGMCFFAGGLKFSEQSFGLQASQANASLLVVAVIAVLIPAAYNAAFNPVEDNTQEAKAILSMSRAAAVILLVIYIAYIIFQLFTHPHLYADVPVTMDDDARRGKAIWGLGKHRAFREAPSAPFASAPPNTTRTTAPPPSRLEEGTAASGSDTVDASDDRHEEEDEEVEEPVTNMTSALILMVIDIVLVGVTSEFWVSSIEGTVAKHPGLSEQWVGLILLPIAGNAAEHVTAVTVSVKDKLDLSIGVAIGSSIQIALFVIPVLTLLAWCIGKPLSLLFDPFQSIVLFLAVLLVNYTTADSRSNYLEGLVLMSVYVIIAVAAYYYPEGASVAEQLFQC